MATGNSLFAQAIEFTPVSIVCLETGGLQNFSLTWGGVPAPSVGTVVIDVAVNPGTTYGIAPNDYQTIPAQGGTTITVNVALGATIGTNALRVIPVNDMLLDGSNIITFTILSVPPGMSIGANSVASITIGDVNAPTTVLQRGDLAIVGVNANTLSCSGITGQDEISFVCFQDITPNTQLFITDNGYERCNPGLWGNTEGVVRIQRTGLTIPAGTVITFRLGTTAGATNVTSVSPDNLWTCLNIGASAVNLNSNGDQIFFMQGGIWLNGAPGTHTATYSGTVLYGFSTNGTWVASCVSNGAQHSNLPNSLECFSMAPTSNTDFSKYTGPLTPNTQRGWLINFDDPAYWTNYASCAAYNSALPNWTTAPVLPITVTGFTAGLWTGAKTTDWFDCRNWDDATVPANTTDVLLDQGALRNCVVAGAVPALCNDLTVSSNAGVRTLAVNNGTLNVSGDVLILRTAGTGALGLQVNTFSAFTATNMTISGSAPGAQDAYFRCETPSSTNTLSGNMTLLPGGLLDLTGVALGGTLNIEGDFQNFASEADHDDQRGAIVFSGNGPQSISTSGFAERFGTLRANKPSGDITVNDPIAVRNTLNLIGGRIMNVPTVTLEDNATAISWSDLSFVHGPMVKIGDDNFSFPVGKGNSVRPISISGLTALATDAFQAEYFALDPQTTFNNVLDPTLDHISSCEHWTLDRSVGSPDAVVTLTWATPNSCGVSSLPDLRVARWDGAVWRDRGNGGTTGTVVNGTVVSAAQQTAFSPWTLASVNTSNPLPIELLSFSAKNEGTAVRLDWSTATETDNDRFTVERSTEGTVFQAILEQAGAGTSLSTLHYTDLDRSPLPGQSYYRLRQTDFDGTTTLGPVVSIWREGSSHHSLSILVNSNSLIAVHDLRPGARYVLMDMTGRIFVDGIVTQEGRTEVPLHSLSHGAYLLRMTDGERVEAGRFVW